ncbi:hypothetical protein BSKO_05881 [Bryopsis sp. KO-2023]|nr:hypothetical protein BSKO_05881 [Bryopsis sp. KO-2023]
MMVTSHDATKFPTRKRIEDENVLSFDRVLCDVPCTSDGTPRKSPELWSQWTVENEISMHIQQLRITLKGCQALKVGGRLVYSTCSLNPIENEAVVAEVIRRTQGAMQLVDVSDKLPLLKRMPGISGWRVYDSTRPNQAEVGVLLRRFSSYKEAEHLRSQVESKLVIDPSLFKNQESDRMPLERCMRVLPHHQDTEGLFIAVLEKLLERHEHKDTVLRCEYRFFQEGLPFVLKYITKRILYINVSDAIRFLVERSLSLLPEDTDQKKDAVASEKHNSAESIPVSDATLLEQLEDFDDGGAVLMLRDSDAQALGFPLSTEAQGVLGIPSAPEF